MLLNFRFRPKINQVSQYIVEGDPEYQNLTLEDRMRKLAIVDKERMDQNREILRKEEHGRYPFKPNINPISKMIVESKDTRKVQELSDITKREQRLLTKKIMAEEDRMKECSFKPKINKPKRFQSIESHYNSKNYAKKIEEHNERKELIVS